MYTIRLYNAPNDQVQVRVFRGPEAISTIVLRKDQGLIKAALANYPSNTKVFATEKLPGSIRSLENMFN